MSVTAPLGFRAAGVAAGLKASGDRDVAVVINDGPSRAAAGVFTTNRVKAAPVLWSEQVLQGGRVRAVLLNSGGANACTGPDGFADTHASAEHLAEALSESAGEIAVCSTGLIGERLPMAALLAGIDAAVAHASRAGGTDAAHAIRTTDTVTKIAFQRVESAGNANPGAPAGAASASAAHASATGATATSAACATAAGAARATAASAAPAGGLAGPASGIGLAGAASASGLAGAGVPGGGLTGGAYSIGGMAKGAGMLAPSLATMLCVLTTDAFLDAPALAAALRAATRVSFDRLDTDGCLSTNDTVLLLASGATGVTPDPAAFTAALTTVCSDLAHQLQADAEGASKLIDIEVVGAASEDDAITAGRAVARSSLLKCAIAGEDPNWGRVLAAVGTTDATFEPDRLSVAINGVWVCRNGRPGDDRAKVDLQPRDVTITVDLAAGPAAATIRTTDLTAAYVHENSAYST